MILWNFQRFISPCVLDKDTHTHNILHPQVQLTPTDTRQNCSTQQYLYLRLPMQAIRVRLNVEVAVIYDESNPNHLWNWMNAYVIYNHNLKLPDFEIFFFELPNRFLHFD